jgi:hypothetical protein
MHLKAKRPVLVPPQFVAELDKLSKATLMDLAYDLAAVASGDGDNEDAVMTTLREYLAVVNEHRKGAKSFYATIKERELAPSEQSR